MASRVAATDAERQRACRRRDKLGLLYTTADTPRWLAEKFIEHDLLAEGGSTNPRLLGAALVKAAVKWMEGEKK